MRGKRITITLDEEAQRRLAALKDVFFESYRYTNSQVIAILLENFDVMQARDLAYLKVREAVEMCEQIRIRPYAKSRNE